MSTLYYHHTNFLKHQTGPGHPESYQRVQAINNALSSEGFSELIPIQASIPNDINQTLALIHHPDYCQQLLSNIPEHGLYALDADTLLSPGSGIAALTAVSSACDAVDKILSGQAKTAFCAVRPPGHHAMPDRAMGFCLFNTVAVTAEYARSRYPIDRVAIVDFDVHHGNGTQAAFAQQSEVLYASSHEMPNFPGTGYSSETGVGNIINVPLTPGSTGIEFREKYRSIIVPALKRFKPELLLISAGFDAHRDDPLASIRLVEDDFRWVTQELKLIADLYCQGRIISCLEGGYNLQALASSAAAHVEALMMDSG